MRLTSVIILCVLVGCADPAKTHSYKADFFVYGHRYEAAAKQYELVLRDLGEKSDSDSVARRLRTLMRLADLRQHYLRDLRGALEAYHRVTDLALGTPVAFYSQLASADILEYRVNDPVGAIGELSQLVVHFPNRPEMDEIRTRIAQLAFAAGQYDVTLQFAALVGTQDLGLAVDAAMVSASAHRIQERSDQAITWYQRVISLAGSGPDVVRAHFELAQVLEELGELDRALNEYRIVDANHFDPAVVKARIARVEERLVLDPKPASKTIAKAGPLPLE